MNQKIKWLICVDSETSDAIKKYCQDEPLYQLREKQNLIVYIKEEQLESIIKDVIKDDFYPYVVFQNRELHQPLLLKLADSKLKFGYLFRDEHVDFMLTLFYPDDEVLESWLNALEGTTQSIIGFNPPIIDFEHLEALQQWLTTHLSFPKTGPYAYLQELMEERTFSRREFRFSSNKDFLVHKDCPWLCWSISQSKALGLLSLSKNIGNLYFTTYNPIQTNQDDGVLAAATSTQADSTAIYIEITELQMTMTIDFPNIHFYRDDSDDDMELAIAISLSLPRGGWSKLKNTQLSLQTIDGDVFFEWFIPEEIKNSTHNITSTEKEDCILFRPTPNNIEVIVDRILAKQISVNLLAE
ncbi:MAG: hypothetical protein KDI39_03960 [Pseudomonadales bacterium]|nr:hypothetical protein [Pseudomonadales bacterium]